MTPTMLWTLSLLALAAPAPEGSPPPPSEGAAPEGGDGEERGGEAGAPDRSHPPEVVPPQVLELAEPEVHRLSDAVEVLHVHVPGVRKYAVSILPRRGMVELQRGRTFEEAMGWLLDTGTEQHDAAALSELEDLHEVDVWSTLRSHYGLLGVEGPREELDLGLELLGELVRGPTFPKADLRRFVEDQELYYLVRGRSRPRNVATALVAYGWYAPGNPYGERPDLSLYDQVDPKALLGAYWAWIDAAPITVLSVGDMAYGDVAPALASMLAGRGAAGAPAEELEAGTPPGSRVLAAAMPGQEQVSIHLRTAAPSRSDEDLVAAWVGAYVLGGHFLSRLNANLREEKGWTYGARASYTRTAHDGILDVSVDVAMENVAGAVREIEGELQRLADEGVTAEEIHLARSRLVADWNETRVTAADTHEQYLGAIESGESMAARRGRYLALAEVTPEQVQEVARRYWGADGVRLWALVGEGEGLRGQLDELGWEAQWVEPSAAILGKVPVATR